MEELVHESRKMTRSGTEHNHAGRSIVLSLFGNGLAGTAGTAAALYFLSPSTVVVGFVRLILGSLTLLLIAPFMGGKFRSLPRLVKRPGIWVMGLSAASYQGFFFASVERTGVATAALVTVGCIPTSAGIVGWIVLRERPNKIWFLATTIGMAGLTIRSLGELQVNDSTGLLYAVIAGTGIGGYLNAAKVELRAGGHPMQLPGMAYLLGSLVLLGIVWSDLVEVKWTGEAIGLALFLGVVTMGIANAFQILGIRGISPGVAATMMLSDPVTAAILGVVVMHEVLTVQGSIGLALVVLGLALQSISPGESHVVRARHKRA